MEFLSASKKTLHTRYFVLTYYLHHFRMAITLTGFPNTCALVNHYGIFNIAQVDGFDVLLPNTRSLCLFSFYNTRIMTLLVV